MSAAYAHVGAAAGLAMVDRSVLEGRAGTVRVDLRAEIRREGHALRPSPVRPDRLTDARLTRSSLVRWHLPDAPVGGRRLHRRRLRRARRGPRVAPQRSRSRSAHRPAGATRAPGDTPRRRATSHGSRAASTTRASATAWRGCRCSARWSSSPATPSGWSRTERPGGRVVHDRRSARSRSTRSRSAAGLRAVRRLERSRGDRAGAVERSAVLVAQRPPPAPRTRREADARTGSVRVGAIVPDDAVGWAEMLVNRDVGHRLGIAHERLLSQPPRRSRGRR